MYLAYTFFKIFHQIKENNDIFSVANKVLSFIYAFDINFRPKTNKIF